MINKQELQKLLALKKKQEVAELSGKEKNEKRDLERQYPENRNKTIKEMEEEFSSREQSQSLGMRR